MDADERAVFDYLKTFGDEWVHAKEICRKAATTKRQYYEDPSWALPVLQRMKDREIVEDDLHARFRIKPVPKKDRKERWVAPDIQKTLQEGGIEVDAENTETASDEYYEQL